MTTENTTTVTEETTTVEVVAEPKVETVEETKVEDTTEVEAKTKKTSSRKKTETSKVEENTTTNKSEVQSVGGEGLELGIFKLNEFTQDPTYGTTHSACFDIRVNLRGLYESGITRVKAVTSTNQPVERKIEKDKEGNLYVDLKPQERLLAPTGAIFDIPVGFSLKVHPRSGTSLKQGINLINQEGVIDADYVQELFLPLVNSSDNYVKIKDGERYAQGELQEVIQAKFTTLKEAPKQKSERDGGFGHTGVQ